MGRALGMALSALGGGLGTLATNRRREEEAAQDADSTLALRGYFRREPKVALPAGAGMMEEMGATTDPILNVAASDAPRTLLPGFRPRPLSATLGMDEPESPMEAAMPGEEMAESARPRPEMLAQLKSAVASKDYSNPVEIGGSTYDYEPERTPEGQRESMRRAMERSADQSAYRAYRASGGTEPFDAAAGHWGEINRTGISQQVRAPRVDPERNQRYYEAAVPENLRQRFPYSPDHDYEKDYAAALTGERTQQNRHEDRVFVVQNPMQGSGGGTTPAQERSQSVQGARGKAQMLARQGVPETAILDHLSYHYGNLEPDVLAGIVTSAMRTYAPRPPAGGGSGLKIDFSQFGAR